MLIKIKRIVFPSRRLFSTLDVIGWSPRKYQESDDRRTVDSQAMIKSPEPKRKSVATESHVFLLEHGIPAFYAKLGCYQAP